MSPTNRSRVGLLGIISSVAIHSDLGEIEFIDIPTASKPFVRYQQMVDLGTVIKARAVKETIAAYFDKRGIPMEPYKADEKKAEEDSAAQTTTPQPTT